MAIDNALICRFRDMVAVDGACLDDPSAEAIIAQYAVSDRFGQEPLTWDCTQTPPTSAENPAWLPTYDLHAAAEDVWSRRAAQLAPDYDFSADGASLSRSQRFEHANQRAAYHAARKRARVVAVPTSGKSNQTQSIWQTLAEEW